MKKLLFYSLFICLLVNCSSGDEDVVEDVPILPVKIIQKNSYLNTNNIITYQYDKNKLKSVIWNGSLKSDYFYTENLISKVNHFDNAGNLIYSTNIEYENNRIKKIIQNEIVFSYTWISDNQVRIQDNRQLNYNVTKYIDVFLSNGNVTKTTLYYGSSTNIEERNITYEYDSKNFPFKNIEGYSKIITSDPELDTMPFNIFPQVNNIIKKTYNGSPLYKGVCTNLVYNNNDFPTSYVEDGEFQVEYNK